MLFDLKKLFQSYEAPVKRNFTVDVSGEDFPGYTVKGLVQVLFTARLEGSAMEVQVQFDAIVLSECARCLDPVEQPFTVKRTFVIRDKDWLADDAELPFTGEGQLDFKELAYTELLLEIPTVLLCNENCAGLCPVCGHRKPCACKHETTDVVDERLSILKQLLN